MSLQVKSCLSDGFSTLLSKKYARDYRAYFFISWLIPPMVIPSIFSIDPPQADSPTFRFDLEHLHVNNISNFQNRTGRDLRAME
jgi:hypothetical protein